MSKLPLKPGQQPANQVGTLAQQLAKAEKPRPKPTGKDAKK